MDNLIGFDDVVIIPATFTDINSRDEVDDINNRLWVSPMDTVVNAQNIDFFYEMGLNTILPRLEYLKYNIKHPHFIALTFAEAEDFLTGSYSEINAFLERYEDKFGKYRILIDMANGHMTKLYRLSNQLKDNFGDHLELMIGNIANPLTYYKYASENVVDYIRLGIGSGSRCYTSSKTGIHYPPISLIKDCAKYKNSEGSNVKIIMDGGIRDSSDIAKCFAAGADGIMTGSLFNKTLESAGTKYYDKKQISQDQAKFIYTSGDKDVFVDYRGMSTIEVQIKEGRKIAKYEEGFSKKNMVEYTLEELLYELNKSLKSTFSYCNSRTFDEFKEKAQLKMVNIIHHNKLN